MHVDSDIQARQRDQLALDLVPVATDLICRVRDDGRESAGHLLASLTDTQRWALPVVLAAMVPDDQGLGELLAWVDQPDDRSPGGRGPVRPLRPCGTHAAYVRHKSRGELPCRRCRTAERAYQRSRPRRRAAPATREGTTA